MTKIPPAALLLLLVCAPVLAQSQSYSFDNFDTTNGVHIYVEPIKARAANTKSRRRTAPASKPVSNVVPTSLAYPIVANSGDNSSLHGYTTGNAEVDNYLINAGTNNS